MNPARRTTAAAATATAVVLATAGSLLTAAVAPASAAVTCTSPVFKRQFFANTGFSGTPKKTDCDNAIDQSWSGAPAAGLPSNNFGVRWTVTRDFGSGGPFALGVSGTDGIRVYLDGVRKINLWSNTTSSRSKTVNLTIPKGKHSLRIDYVNWTGAAKVKFTYTPRTSASVDKVKPLAPTGTSVSYDKATGKAKLTWAKNKEMDLAGYKVYRRLNGTWTRLTTTTATSYTDTTLPKNGATYYYEVRAHDKAGNQSAGSADRAVTTVDTSAPAAPTGVEDNWAIGMVTSVKLYWDGNSESDIAGYRVYRSTSKPVAPTAENLVGTPSSAAFQDTPPQTGDWYYYVVTAVDTHGNESAVSGTAEFETYDTTAPAFVPTDLAATSNEHDVTLTWSWNRDQDADLETFRVYRDGAYIGDASGEFVDHDVEPGTTYTYHVRAEDDDGNLGPASASVTVEHLGDRTPPGTVTGLTATSAENGILLDWDDSTAADFDHYEVYRSQNTDGVWTAYTNITDSLPFGSSQSANRDPNLPDDENLRYAVVAVDANGNALDVASATTVDVNEFNMTPDQTYAETSDILTTDSAYGEIYLSYNEAADTYGTATALRVYRWDNSTHTYVQQFDTQATDYYRFTDTTAPSDSTVFYKVTAVYADGTESAPVGTWMFT
ncbi:PA14 domain-containing protein [Streptomyces blattellae]|uniref:PA14 domain-containing protein n=1 Tax=Streptomyces blattellae TaxID=2569855 RepID=UPI0012B8231C|nr:PA14 domain-containing protein [Streptomyces blattellae]